MFVKGSALSGNRGHAGREGLKGGSLPNNPFMRGLVDRFNAILDESNPHKQAEMLHVVSSERKNAPDADSKSDFNSKIKQVGKEVSQNYYNYAESKISEIMNSNESDAVKLALLTVANNQEFWPVNNLHLNNLDSSKQFEIGEIYRKAFNQLASNKLPDGSTSDGQQTTGFTIVSNSDEYGKAILESELKAMYNPNHQEAIDFYFGGGGDAIVNNYARNGTLPSINSDTKAKLGNDIDNQVELSNRVKSSVEMIDNSMTDSLQKNFVLTRRVGKGHPIYDALSNGKNVVDTIYTESGYSSTSLNYASTFGKKDNLNIRILAPKGTKGISFYGVKYMSTEYEFLLPRNLSFKVTGYNQMSNEVFVEIVN